METLIDLIRDYPWFANVVVIMGSLRVIMKPLFSLIDAITNATPTNRDDETWRNIKGSSAFAIVIWFIDYVASVKINVVKRR